MKKITLLFCLAMFCVSCDPDQNAWRWIVTNNTEQALTLKFPYSKTYQTHTLKLGDRMALLKTTTDPNERYNLHFGHYFEEAVGENGEDIYWQILSEDGVVLKTWNYSDKGLPDQRFFEESSWSKEQVHGGSGFIVDTHLWTFEIQPEDISSN